METTVKIKLSSGKELELTLAELDELKNGLVDNTSTDYTKWYPAYPVYPVYPVYPSSPWSGGDIIYTTDLRVSNTSGKDDKTD